MNQAARDKVISQRAVLLVTQGFFGALLYNLRLVEDPAIPTACTDGKQLRYSPDYVLKLTAPQLRGLLVEEVSHIAHLHHTRRQGREPELWNVAADLALSPRLKNGGFDIADMLYEPRFAGQSAEQIYATLQREAPAKRRAMIARGSGRGQVTDAPGGEAAREAAEMEAQSQVRAAVAIAKKRREAGSIPGDILASIDAFDRGRVNWKQRLRVFAEDSAIKETDWRRPSRRSPWPIILPGYSSTVPRKAVIGLDWSGSTMGAPRKAFGGELQSMLDERAVGELVIVFHDVDVKRVDRYEPGDLLKLESHGNGGTAFGPALKWIEENEPDASCVIFLTDGDASDHATVKPPGPPVLWCRVPGFGTPSPSFGETIEIDAHG